MKFGIFGAGSIGCHVGGMLAAHGEDVVLVGRPAMKARLTGGMRLSTREGFHRELPPGGFVFSTQAEALSDRDVVLVCVKSGDTAEAGRSLGSVLAPAATVVSLQNGVSNAARLREALGGRTVLAAMVPFNVARLDDNRFHRGTEGTIVIEAADKAEHIAQSLSAAAVPARTASDIAPILWGKLLMNLNNPVNALSGLPLRAQLSDRDYRRALALAVAEALAVLKAAGIRPARIGKVRPQVIPTVLRLPDRLFSIVASGMLKIDAQARSSMAEDLEAGRKPEIDQLNGEIVELGRRVGVETPVNAAMVEAVKAAFAAGRPPRLSGREMLALLAGKPD